MSDHIKIEITEATLRKLVVSYLLDKLGDIELDESNINIQTKSKQNYRSEWETADFRASVSVLI